MWRHLRIYGYLLRFSFSKAMEFRIDFFFRIAMDILYYAVNIAFFRLLFLHTTLLGGWSEAQMMVFVSGYLMVDAVNMTLFSNNMFVLPMLVNRGDLDYHLVRPVSTLFFVSLRDFAAGSFVNFLMTAGILVWALARFPGPISAGQLGLYLALLALGSFLHYCVRMFLLLPVFWTHSVRGFDQVFWALSHFMERPDRIFAGWLRKILVFVIPFALMASFPARAFFEGPAWTVLGPLLGVGAAFTGILLFYWKKALAAYSSASS
jgi:ABC-2 type transport system permease protein